MNNTITLDRKATLLLCAIQDFNDTWIGQGKKIPGNFRKIEDTPQNRELYSYSGHSFSDKSISQDPRSFFFITFNNTREEHCDYYEHEIAFIYNSLLEKFGKEDAEEYLQGYNVLFAVKEYGVNPRKYLEEDK